VAAMAKMNLLKTINPTVMTEGSVFAPDAQIVYDQRPDWMKRWEVTGLLKFDDKNGDGRIQYYNDKSKDADFQAKATAAGWQGSELTVNADIIVLANPEIALLPNWVIALVAAGGLAAALSTAAGLLLAISSAISHDLLKDNFMPNLTEKGELMAGKIAMAGSIVVAGYLGLNPPGFAAGTVAIAFGLAASSIFPALMMGIFSKTMNKQGAMAGMLAGIGITMLYVFAHKGIFFIKGTEFVNAIGGENFFFGIEPNAFGTIGAIVNFVVAFAVKNMTPAVPHDIAEMVEQVRIPRGAKAVDGAH
jgi:cation/acetate symporter